MPTTARTLNGVACGWPSSVSCDAARHRGERERHLARLHVHVAGVGHAVGVHHRQVDAEEDVVLGVAARRHQEAPARGAGGRRHEGVGVRGVVQVHPPGELAGGQRAVVGVGAGAGVGDRLAAGEEGAGGRGGDRGDGGCVAGRRARVAGEGQGSDAVSARPRWGRRIMGRSDRAWRVPPRSLVRRRGHGLGRRAGRRRQPEEDSEQRGHPFAPVRGREPRGAGNRAEQQRGRHRRDDERGARQPTRSSRPGGRRAR